LNDFKFYQNISSGEGDKLREGAEQWWI